MRGSGILRVLPWAIGLAGCGSGPLPGSYWDISIVDATDFCHEEPVNYAGQTDFEYRLVFEGSAVNLLLEDEGFAKGTISGCEISYQSVVWPSTVDGFEVKWQITGEASFRAGSTGCNLDEGVDWLGVETFEIVSDPDDHPEIEPGCTYALTTQGVFTETITE